MFRKLKKHSPLLFSLFFLVFVGCTTNYYITARNLQQRGNFIGAVENYDEFIAKSGDGSMITKALNHRSETYYLLGSQAMERENYRLAIRYFYLANNEKADTKMIDCYVTIIDTYDTEEDMEAVLNLCSSLIDTFLHIPEITRVIYRRLVIIHENEEEYEAFRKLTSPTAELSERELRAQRDMPGDFQEEFADLPSEDYEAPEQLPPHHQAILDDYEFLAEKDTEGIYIAEARRILDEYMPVYIEEAKDMYSYIASIEQLQKLLSYTDTYHNRIRQEIGAFYLITGDEYRSEEKYQDAEQYYTLAMEYDPSLEAQITERFNQTVNQMIDRGNVLLSERKVDQAIEIYRQTFSIIPDNEAAQRAINQAEELKRTIAEAQQLYDRALQMEDDKRYEDALRLYQRSYAKDRLPRTSEKIFLMNNMLEIEEDPENFARKIIAEYDNGMIVRNLNEIASGLREEHGEGVNVSGWRVMLSTGTYRYEIRYDITSRTDSYYFIWQVNLLNRRLTPLNTISAEIMES